MKTNMRIGIAGAGLTGRLTAWRLSQSGINVELFDSDSSTGESSCAYIAGGMLAPYCELVQSEPDVSRLGYASIDLWRRWSEDLAGVRFEQRGTIVVAHQRDLSDLRHWQSMLFRKLPDSGLPIEVEQLAEDQLFGKEPALPRCFSEGLYLPLEGHLDSLKVMKVLEQAIQAEEIVWHRGVSVKSVENAAVCLDSREHRYDFAIDCRGTGALASIPHLRGVRGESILLSAPEVFLNRPIRLIHPRYSLYVVPRDEGRFLIGATQIESEDYSPVSVQSALELLSAAYSLHPGFKDARIVSFGSNCRPALPDNRPTIYLGQDTLRINGLFRHGFMCAPKMVEAIAGFIINGEFEKDFKQGFVKEYAYGLSG